jgi:hypothetical protein
MRAATLLRETGEVALAAPIFVTAPLLRHWHLRWGATDDEVAAPMPGDEIVAQPSFCATRAITIDAPPEIVWRWLVQVGIGRAGFYSYDLLDNAGRPSANAILPEHQSPRVGDRMPMAAKVTDTTSFRVAAVDPGRTLLWEKPHSTWSWTLAPLAGGQATRLVTRLQDHYAWRESPALALLSLILFEHGDFPMMRRMLIGIRARAEREARRA